jgi:glycosylphosphatidylinositol deacylase
VIGELFSKHNKIGMFSIHFNHGLNVMFVVSMFLYLYCFCSHRLQKTLLWNAKKDDRIGPQLEKVGSLGDELKKPSALTHGETQIDTYHHRQGLLLLHLLCAVMLGPSLAAWVQVVTLSHLHKSINWSIFQGRLDVV